MHASLSDVIATQLAKAGTAGSDGRDLSVDRLSHLRPSLSVELAVSGVPMRISPPPVVIVEPSNNNHRGVWRELAARSSLAVDGPTIRAYCTGIKDDRAQKEDRRLRSLCPPSSHTPHLSSHSSHSSLLPPPLPPRTGCTGQRPSLGGLRLFASRSLCPPHTLSHFNSSLPLFLLPSFRLPPDPLGTLAHRQLSAWPLDESTGFVSEETGSQK